MFEENYRTIDFRPAPPGWSVVHIDEAGWCHYTDPGDGTGLCKNCEMPKPHDRHLRIHRYALPGWLIQEETGSGHRRVVPAEIDDDGALLEVLNLGRWNNSAWYISGPNDPAPTVEDIIEQRQERAEQRRIALAEIADRSRQKQLRAA
jgi:hypothetical protein